MSEQSERMLRAAMEGTTYEERCAQLETRLASTQLELTHAVNTCADQQRRAENAEAALEHVADLYTQACEQRDDADALLLEYSQDALDDLNNWSGYATDYFQQKHDLAGDQAKWQARIDAHLAREEKP